MEEDLQRPRIFQPDEACRQFFADLPGQGDDPDSLTAATRFLHAALAHGMAVKITPLRTELPIEEAAGAIGMSGRDLRAYAVEGEVVVRSTEYVDWVRLTDVVDFDERLRARRRAALDEMLAESVYDEDD